VDLQSLETLARVVRSQGQCLCLSLSHCSSGVIGKHQSRQLKTGLRCVQVQVQMQVQALQLITGTLLEAVGATMNALRLQTTRGRLAMAVVEAPPHNLMNSMWTILLCTTEQLSQATSTPGSA
jgi:hypothetical protein